jgi:VWFA-related protein
MTAGGNQASTTPWLTLTSMGHGRILAVINLPIPGGDMDSGLKPREVETPANSFVSASQHTPRCIPPGWVKASRYLLFIGLLLAGTFGSSMRIGGQGSGEQEITTQDEATFKIKAQRNEVLLRVIVRDSSGRAVSSLRKEDFRLTDNGKLQEIVQFAVESPAKTSANERQAAKKESGVGGAAEAGPPNAIPGNYQALYFDDLQMRFEDIVHARDAADRYIAVTMNRADRVAIFTSSGHGNLDFTDDRSKLHEALLNLRLWPRALIQADLDSLIVLQGLQQVVRRTSVMPGRRSVILVSSGISLIEYVPLIDEVADRALRSNVVINTLNPRGLMSPFAGSEPSQVFTTLFSLAEATGGVFFHKSNDLDEGFRQVGTLADASYMLSFSPQNLKYDGRFHKLKVNLVKPSGFSIQARAGYYAPNASEDAAANIKEEIEQAVFSQDELKELPADVHTRFFKINESDVRLTVLTHLDLGSLRFRKEVDRNLENLTLVTALFDRDGKFIDGKEKRVELRLRDSTLARLTPTGITLKVEFTLKPGTYLVRQVVRDSEAGQLTGLNRTVEIPY